ncbi:PDDEXK nuclease domain-containing protein [Chitinophaga tropicalis]|uniref:DUF1016 family protein n=1 Tax=Chitinophaga tropicalis TaxID=2683588 RepID=A0A7K1UBB3_9BACT|nr:PDDEXK nuclease domain-containing protein [Chitinophaga tropicalis]MVT11681.1 DUF1016 family protein [Chitinophaga tropicalis]
MQNQEYLKLIAALKDNILRSRYNAARLANREQLLLYYSVGKMLLERITAAGWGAKILKAISADLQKEWPGLRGFSAENLKKMRQFYETYADFQSVLIGSAPPNQLGASDLKSNFPVLAELSIHSFLEVFTSLGFTHHFTLLKVKDLSARWFYMQQAAQHQWSYRTLEYHMEADLYSHKGKLPNNFNDALPFSLHKQATDAFKDEYLLDFINSDPTYEADLENEIVTNIKQFIMRLGKGFAFIGNQYRLTVGGEEFFIDLLFYNRILRCLVVFELKKEKFRPEHAGHLNFYLNVLDDQERQPGENPAIGIILCREKDNTQVEYAFKSMDKAMGVATYKLTTKVPQSMKDVLPSPDDLVKLL